MRTALFLLAGVALAAPAAAADPAARTLVEQALAAQGGVEALRAIHAVRLHEIVERNAIEQSVRPDGPFFQNIADTVETRRLGDAPALRTEARNRGFLSSWWTRANWAETTNMVVDGVAYAVRGGTLGAASQSAVAPAEASLALGPERALLTALAASDLARAAPEELHGRAHDVVTFRWHDAPVKLYLAPVSHMPAAVEITRPHPLDIFLSPWGDVTTRVEWDGWTAEANGVRYPRLLRRSVNGTVESTTMIDAVELNPAIAPDTFAIPAETAAKAKAARRPVAALPFPADHRTEIAPGIAQIQGRWNIVEVEQPDGVYVVEGPISNAYSTAAIADARTAGKPLLGVVTTSDAWPHIGGLREYVAEGVPIIALDLNRPTLERLFASPHVQAPDHLAEQPRKPMLRTVSAPTTIGSGDTAMRLIPLRTASGERQMAIYWPAHRLLYTSDLIAVRPDAVWLPQYRDEIASVIAREGLDVETVFGMHYAPVAWSKVQAMQAPGVG
ncbi:MAG TPA: hypothetical protein VM657_12940 [Sphingomonas sp.]|nr:hypothetical protein [Sphingomonas sp.]